MPQMRNGSQCQKYYKKKQIFISMTDILELLVLINLEGLDGSVPTDLLPVKISVLPECISPWTMPQSSSSFYVLWALPNLTSLP